MEYREMYQFLKWNPQNKLIIWQKCFELAQILWYLHMYDEFSPLRLVK
jgi:hypothetical protein